MLKSGMLNTQLLITENILKPELGGLRLYENSHPLVPVLFDIPWMKFVSLFPSSQPSNCNFFLLNCNGVCAHSPVEILEFRTNPCRTRKEIKGTLPLPVKKFYGIALKCIVSMWLHFMKLL